MHTPIRKPLRPDRVAQLIAACSNTRQRLVILALVEAGLQSSELSGLHQSDVDWEEGTLRVAGRPTRLTASVELLSTLREYFGKRPKIRLGIRQIQRIVREVASTAGLSVLVGPDVLRRTWRQLSGQTASFPSKGRRHILEAAADAAIDVILIADDEHRLVDLNRAGLRLFQLPREEIVGRPIEDFFSLAQREPVQTVWNAFVAEGEQCGVCMLIGPSQRKFEYRAKAHFRPGLHMSILREVPAESHDKSRGISRMRSKESRQVSRT